MIDAHVKIGPSFDNTGVLFEDYLVEMKKNNINKAVLCPNKPISYKVEDGNKYVYEIVSAYPQCSIMAMRVDPYRIDEMLDNYSRMKDKIKFFYFHPFEDSYSINSDIVKEFLSTAKKNIPVIIEAGYPWRSHITQIVDLARNFPDRNFIATNAGQLDLSASTLDDVALSFSKSNNIILGTASACGAQWLADLSESYPNRIVFESNFPMMVPYLEIYRINNGFFDPEIKAKIFDDNITKLIP